MICLYHSNLYLSTADVVSYFSPSKTDVHQHIRFAFAEDQDTPSFPTDQLRDCTKGRSHVVRLTVKIKISAQIKTTVFSFENTAVFISGQPKSADDTALLTLFLSLLSLTGNIVNS